jgi:hypothetical protein
MAGHQDRTGDRRWFSTAVFVFGVVLLAILPLSGPLQSEAAAPLYTIQTYAPDGWYTGIYLADMDRDGWPDVLIGNRDTKAVEIWKYNRNLAKLVLQQSIPFPADIHDI